jgi:ElaB/YqjD/DUF883 family membrane-anchored ribosome-binding protein
MSNSNLSWQSATPSAQTASDTPTVEKARERAHEAVDSAAARAEPLERRVRSEATSAQQKLHETKEAATGKVEDSLASLESFIKARPMTAAGIAFAAGILASRLMRS